MTTLSLIDKLRRRIKDDRPTQRALSLAVTEETVSRAIAEVSDHHLVVSVSGSGAPSVDLALTDMRYSTIGRVHQSLSRLVGYTVLLDEDAQEDHLSVDFYPMPPTDVGPGRPALELKHHVFSDTELDEILREAIQRHNPSFSMSAIPDSEHVFIMQLAHAEVCRRQAYDSSKRKGLSETVTDLLALATSLESTYTADVKRLARAIASPKESPSNNMQEGDVVIGTMFRSSLRTGFQSPMSQNLPPVEAELYEPDDVRDIEDQNIRARWARNRDNDFYSYEVWLDTVPDVQREGSSLAFQGSPFAGTPVINADEHRATIRPTTSNLVFRSWGANSNFDSAAFHTFIEELGQEITQFNIGDLEPDTDYFLRLYILDLNYDVTASNVVRYHTKPLRTRFADTNPILPVTGPATTVITMNFDADYGPVTTSHKCRIGGTEVPLTVVTPTQATAVVPSFTNKRVAKDVVIVSPTKLFDVRSNVFTVT